MIKNQRLLTWPAFLLFFLASSLLPGTLSAQLSVGFTDIVEPICFGTPTGSARAVASGGNSPYNYTWSNGANGPTLNGVTAGVYTVTVVDADNNTVSGNVSIDQPDLLFVEFETQECTLPLSVTALGMGGVPPYAYRWSTGERTATIRVQADIQYCVTVTDDNNCGAVDCVTVQFNPPSVSVETESITCPGDEDGSITATPSGGKPPYTYAWSNGDNGATISGLSPGSYTVTLTDAAGCTDTATGNVAPKAAIEIGMGKTDPTCVGETDGSIDASVAGGTPPYTYAWSNGATTQDISGLGPGIYTLTVTDSKGCPDVRSIELDYQSGIRVGVFPTPETCPDANDGFLTANVNSGVMPYTYLWSDGSTTQVVTGVSPGTYTVTVTDAVGCQATDVATVVAAPDFVLEVTAQNVSVCDGSNGSAQVTVVSGVGPYTYNWSNGGTTATISGLSAGTYRVTVTSMNDCVATGSVTLTEPPPLRVIAAGSGKVCPGSATGIAIASVSGGTPPYDYSWSNGGTTDSIDGLEAGTYRVTVTDAAGCTDIGVAEVTAAAGVEITVNGTAIVCGEGNTGSVSVRVNAGTPPYTYEWSNGANGDFVPGLGDGTYTVMVTDANGCSASGSFTIRVIDDLDIRIEKMDIDCKDAKNGSVTAMATGGDAPYQYLWDTGATTASLTGLGPGAYRVTATDANGCSVVASATISEPDRLSVLRDITPVSCKGAADGEIELTVNGGTPPYSYSWSHGPTTQNVAGLSVGTYVVVVTDDNGCSVSLSIRVAEPESLSVTVDAPAIDCAGSSSGTVSAIVNGGTPPYSYQWSTGATTGIVNGLPAGTYDVTVTDLRGCTAVATDVVLSELPELVISFEVTDIECSDDDIGALDASVSGGTPPYTFMWSTGETTESISGLGVGTYTLTVTDVNGCSASDAASITSFDGPVCEITKLADVVMGGDGSLEVIAGEGQPPYTYLWSNDATTSVITGLDGGFYSVTVTDANGCQTTCFYDLIALAGLGDYVWEDIDRDGLQDDAEPGVAGVEVKLKDAAGEVIATTMTDMNGFYSFVGLQPGEYSVMFVKPDDFNFTQANIGSNESLDSDAQLDMDGMTEPVTLAPGEFNPDLDAGIYNPPSGAIADPCDCLNNATDEFNGQFREVLEIRSYPGETWTITAQSNMFLFESPAPPAAPIPVPLGTELHEVEPGVYELEFKLVDEMTYTVIATNGLDEITLSNTCVYPVINVDDFPPASICLSDDPIPLSASPSIPGKTKFFLDGMEVTELDPAVLGLGEFEFKVEFTPNDPDECIATIIEMIAIVDDCFAKIGDYVWDDVNRNGIQDADEKGIQGVKVTLTETGVADPYTDMTTTDASGMYMFSLPPGNYKLTFSQPDDYMPTQANAGGDDTRDSDIDPDNLMITDISLENEEVDLTLDAGFHRICVNVTDPGAVGYDQYLCAPGNDPEPFVSLAPATGGQGPIEYLWMYSTKEPTFNVNTWTPIENSNSLTYDAGPLYETTYFARCARRENCPSFLETTVVTVEVGTETTAEIGGPTTICSGETHTYTAVGAGAGAHIRWDFGPGAVPRTAEGATAEVYFTSFGNFTITLQVTEDGCTATDLQRLTVSNNPATCGSGFVIDAEVMEASTRAVRLSWEADQFQLPMQFTVEYSTDGETFMERTEVSQATEVSGSKHLFSYVDHADKQGRSFYRVKIADGFGGEAYSNIEEVIFYNESRLAMLYPNPVFGTTTVELFETFTDPVVLELFSVAGMPVRSWQTAPDTSRMELDLTDLPSGVYLLRLRSGKVNVKTIRVVKYE